MRNATKGFKTLKNVYRYAKKSLVGGSAGVNQTDIYNKFREDVAQLIPDTKAQAKVSSETFNTPITINNTQFPNNIILYAFIIFYCLKVHNFKINTTEDGTKNTGLLIGLVDILIEVLKNMLAEQLLTNLNLKENKYDATDDDNNDKLFKILDIILHNRDITTHNALDTVNVKDYIIINEQNTGSILQPFRKSKISSITINVVLETNVLKNPVAISFNTDLKQLPNNTPPPPGADDSNLEEIKKYLKRIVSSIYANSVCKYKAICAMFHNNNNDNILLKQLISNAFDNLIGKNNNGCISKYYDVMKTILKQNKNTINTNIGDDGNVKAYVCNSVMLNAIIQENTILSNIIRININKINEFTIHEALKPLKALLSYIDNYYKVFTKILTKQKENNEDEAYYKNAITQDIKSINDTDTNTKIDNIHNNIANYIINLYLQKIMYCCIILYAIEQYTNLKLKIYNTYGKLPNNHPTNPKVNNIISFQ